MTEADISADSEQNPKLSRRLVEIGDSLRDQRREALNTLVGVQVLESLVQLFEDGKLTSDDLSTIGNIVEYHRQSPNKAPTEGLEAADAPLSQLSLPSVRLTRFEAWCLEMKELNDLAILHEGLLTSSRFIFSYPRVSVQAAPGFDNVSGAAKLRLSSVPQLNALESADPLSTLFKGSPLIEGTAIPRLDTGEFQAVISVPDFSYQSELEDLDRDVFELKNGTSSGKVKIPADHLLLAILRFDSDKHSYVIDNANLRSFWIAGGIPDHRIVNTNSVDWSAFFRSLRAAFKESTEEDEKNLLITREYAGAPIIVRQKSPEAPLPSPYTIFARCLDAIAKTHLQKNERVGWLRLPNSGKSRAIDKQIENVDRPEVWEISASIEQFRNERQLDQLIEALEKAKTGHSLHEHLSLSTSIWLYRTVDLLQSRVENEFQSFFNLDQEMQNIDDSYPVSRNEICGPFRDFYDEVALIREDSDYPNEETRRNHAQVAIKNLTAAINDTL